MSQTNANLCIGLNSLLSFPAAFSVVVFAGKTVAVTDRAFEKKVMLQDTCKVFADDG